MKMSKVQLIVELLNCTFDNNFGGIPPRVDCNITKVNFFQGSCIIIFITKSFVPILKLKSNELLSVLVERLNAMEKTSLFLVNHLHNGISTLRNDIISIPICLGTICHEPFEIGISYTFLQEGCI